VLDTAPVDARRQLVIIRRDNVEHLLMIGGGSDLVIETNIVRASPANAGRDNTGRTTSALDTPRTSPVYEGSSWPAPQPETSVRLRRTYPIEEPAQWRAPLEPEPSLRADRSAPASDTIPAPQPVRQEPSLRTHRSASHESPIFSPSSREAPVPPTTGPILSSLRAPGERPTPSQFGTDAPAISSVRPEPPLAPAAQPAAPPVNVAARLVGRLDAPQRQAPPESQVADTPARTPVQATAARAEEADAPLPMERQAGETAISPDARPKSAAGPRFSFPNLKFDRSAPSRTAPPPVKSDRPTARPGPVTAAPERGPARPKSKTLYESLEQEMASLLGKPPGKP
jgi:hypothetical protein